MSSHSWHGDCGLTHDGHSRPASPCLAELDLLYAKAPFPKSAKLQ
jgi:hypothetical protein